MRNAVAPTLCSLVLLLSTPASAQAPPKGRVPNENWPSSVAEMLPPDYQLPATGYRVAVKNVTRAKIVCDVQSPKGFGGRYRIGPGTQFEFVVEAMGEEIELRCPQVRNGAPLVQVKPSTRYIFRRSGPLRKLGVGPIEFNEVI